MCDVSFKELLAGLYDGAAKMSASNPNKGRVLTAAAAINALSKEVTRLTRELEKAKKQLAMDAKIEVISREGTETP